MKKLLSLALVMIMICLAIAGCAANGGVTSAPPADNSKAPAPSTDASAPASEAPASEKPAELKTVRLVFPRTAEVLEDTPYWVAENLGYLAEEGLHMEVIEAFGTTDIKMVSTGNAEFACPGPSYILAALEEGLPIKVVSAYDAINIWGMCVLSNGPIQSWEDMKDAKTKYGKKLTVALGDASWELLVTPTLVAAGVDPKEDIEWVVAGENRYIQVKEGKCDMLFTWPGEAWQLMGQGFDFKYIDGNEVLQTSSNPVITSLDMIQNDPETVAGFVRALAKGIYFVHYNKEAAAAVSCNQWPDIDITWKAAVYVQEGRSYQMFGKPGNPDEQKLIDNIGTSWEDKWKLNIQAAHDSGVIKSTDIALDKIYTNEFVDTSWDKKAVEADADAYDVESCKARYKAE